MEITFEIDNIEVAEEYMHAAEIATDEVIQEELERLLAEVVAEARSNLQNNRSVVSADLNASIQILDINHHEGTVGTELYYAIYIEIGRGWVLPVTAKALHWINPDTGLDVFSLSSAPTEPKPFFYPAVITKSAGFAEQVHQKLKDKILELTGINSG